MLLERRRENDLEVTKRSKEDTNPSHPDLLARDTRKKKQPLFEKTAGAALFKLYSQESQLSVRERGRRRFIFSIQRC